LHLLPPTEKEYVEAEATSTYAQGWDAEALTGEPRVYPTYGDTKGAWAPLNSSGTEEVLTLKYKDPIYMSGIFIFETYHPGYVASIEVENYADGSWIQVYSSQIKPAKEVSRVFPVIVERTTYLTKSIKISLDCRDAPSWVEIDCVALRGIAGKSSLQSTNLRRGRNF